jgi:hypothetical protein
MIQLACGHEVEKICHDPVCIDTIGKGVVA